MRLRPKHLTFLAATLGAVITVAVATIPTFRFAYRSPVLHIAFDTAEGLIALTAAYLLFGRLRERELLRDALLVLAFLLVGSANLFLLVTPASALGSTTQAVSIWGSLMVRVLGAGAIAWASVSGARTVPERWSKGWRIPLSGAALFIVAATSAQLASARLPVGIAPTVSPAQSGALVVGHPAMLGTQLLLVALFALAAIGFTKAAERADDDPFVRWLGPGTALSALARFNYFLFPSIYTQFIYVGDLLRLAFYLMVLLGASQEIRHYWRRLENDIAQRDHLYAELEKLSLTDVLTGLNNRRGFETLAEHEIKLASRFQRPLAVMFIDLNEMKTINDVHGHETGDDALRETAALLTKTFRESDLIARMGGDEFCSLAVAGPVETELLVSRLQANVEAANAASSRPYRLSLSVGVSHHDIETKGPVSLRALMDEADELMYGNKRSVKARHSILVVDDDPSIGDLMEAELDEDFDVSVAVSAAAALQKISLGPPDLVILDYFLPDGSGAEVIGKLRAALGSRAPIITLTGASDVDEAGILRAGSDDYLEKPFEWEVLRARIERLLARARHR